MLLINIRSNLYNGFDREVSEVQTVSFLSLEIPGSLLTVNGDNLSNSIVCKESEIVGSIIVYAAAP